MIPRNTMTPKRRKVRAAVLLEVADNPGRHSTSSLATAIQESYEEVRIAVNILITEKSVVKKLSRLSTTADGDMIAKGLRRKTPAPRPPSTGRDPENCTEPPKPKHQRMAEPRPNDGPDDIRNAEEMDKEQKMNAEATTPEKIHEVLLTLRPEAQTATGVARILFNATTPSAAERMLVHRRLKKLESSGQVSTERDGKALYWRPEPMDATDDEGPIEPSVRDRDYGKTFPLETVDEADEDGDDGLPGTPGSVTRLFYEDVLAHPWTSGVNIIERTGVPMPGATLDRLHRDGHIERLIDGDEPYHRWARFGTPLPPLPVPAEAEPNNDAEESALTSPISAPDDAASGEAIAAPAPPSPPASPLLGSAFVSERAAGFIEDAEAHLGILEAQLEDAHREVAKYLVAIELHRSKIATLKRLAGQS